MGVLRHHEQQTLVLIAASTPKNGLWGFCPTTVISASDCGLAGNCVDSHACTAGCGIKNVASITTFTW